jgi:hypothetical protein
LELECIGGLNPFKLLRSSQCAVCEGFALRANGFVLVVPTLAAKAAARMGHPDFFVVKKRQGLIC